MTEDERKDPEEIFLRALRKDRSERKAYLLEACAGDEALRLEVESLLEAHDRADRFIERSARVLLRED